MSILNFLLRPDAQLLNKRSTENTSQDAVKFSPSLNNLSNAMPRIYPRIRERVTSGLIESCQMARTTRK
jgi:hypothetical protein